MRWKQLAGGLVGLALGSIGGALAAPAQGYDRTAPQLVSVRVSPVVDLMVPGNKQVLVDLSATDGQTGLRNITLEFTGPLGAYGYPVAAQASRTLSAPMVAWQGRVVWTPSSDTVPGAWLLTQVALTDLNGNTVRYGETALAGLGSTALTVLNASKDAVAPKLVSGRLLNDTLSQAAMLPGATYWRPAFVQADLVVRDRVQPGYILSGVDTAELIFCEQAALPWGCGWYNQFTLQGSPGWRRTGQYTLNTSGSPFADHNGLPLGVYELVTVRLTDLAGNKTQLTGKPIGGETDFSTLFPSTVMTLTP